MPPYLLKFCMNLLNNSFIILSLHCSKNAFVLLPLLDQKVSSNACSFERHFSVQRFKNWRQWTTSINFKQNIFQWKRLTTNDFATKAQLSRLLIFSQNCCRLIGRSFLGSNCWAAVIELALWLEAVGLNPSWWWAPLSWFSASNPVPRGD